MSSNQKSSAILRVCADLLNSVARAGAERQVSEDLQAYDAEKVPARTLERYMARWVQYTEAEDIVAVIAAIYIDRVCMKTGLHLNKHNVHRVLLAALLLASKWMEEDQFRMSHYAAVGAVDIAELRELESCFLRHVGWELHINRAEQEKYLAVFRNHPAWEASEV